MSDFTSEQLEALKDGTTPGPWGHTSLGYEAEKYPVYGDVPGDEVALVRRQDWELVSAAPALVDALIAEKRAHQKLRAEIEALIRDCISSAETFEHNAMTAYSPEACESASTVERDTAAALTRILEADDA